MVRLCRRRMVVLEVTSSPQANAILAAVGVPTGQPTTSGLAALKTPVQSYLFFLTFLLGHWPLLHG